MPYSFAQQRSFGKWGERCVLKHLEEHKDIQSVRDVSEEKEWQEKGIDFIIEGQGNDNYWTADVKLDMLHQRTGNLFIETMSSAKKEGCAITTKADKFLYFCPKNKKTNPGEGTLYYLDMRMFQNWYKENEGELRKQELLRSVKNEGYESEGIAMTIELLQELKFITEEAIAIEMK
jgi:hypothetical protein